MKWKWTIAIWAVLAALPGIGQDIHFSQFPYSPLNLNPSHAGLYDADYRFSLNYRNQWRNELVPFNTISLGFEMPIKDLANGDRLASGALLFFDQAGDLKFRTLQLEIPINYIKAVGADKNHLISFGIQPGMQTKSIDVSDIRLDENYNPNDIGEFDPINFPSSEIFQNTGFTDFDLGAGATHTMRLKERTRLEYGLAVRHLLQPRQTFFDNSDVRLNIKYTVHSLNTIKVGEKWDFLPQFIYQRQDTKQEIVLGTSMRVYLKSDNPYRDVNILFGHYWRNRDASIAFVGMEYNELHVGISYDFNVLSDLKNASDRRGGIEASIIYKIKKVDKQGFEDAFCPLF